jgi:dipeptidyl aminopeptidase/acylaminoacyl peptidase
MRSCTTRLPLALLLCFFIASDSKAQERVAAKSSLDLLLDELTATRRFQEVAISPDGKSLAWVESVPQKSDEAKPGSAIYIADLELPAAAPRRVTADVGAHSEHSVAWSADSKQIAFLSDKEKTGQLQLYACPAAGKEFRKLTKLSGGLAHARWSPDGKQIALLNTEGASGPTGPTQAATPELGEVGNHTPAQRLTIIDVGSGRVQTTAPAALHVHEYDWAPDGRQLAAVASPAPGDCNWYVARLYTMSVATGKLQEILKLTMQIAVPRWSPDGKTIAFIGGLMSDEGANGGEIYTVSASGGPARNRTPGLAASVSWLAWQQSSDQISFTEHIAGGSGIGTVRLDNGETTHVWTGAETIAAEGGSPAISLSRDGKTSALIRHSFERPPEVWAGPIGEWKQITNINSGARRRWGKSESLHWKCDEKDVQGWLLYPHDYDPKQRYPMVVSVHGGPASARRPAWPGTFFDLSVLANEGYFVFFPNPRGSFGFGEEFARANVKDFGHGDLRDILKGVDVAVKTTSVDEKRLGIAGWSYGGYMTMWAVTQTTRFQTAVAGAGIANWQSYYGQNGIDQWLLPYFGATVYEDPAVYARSSPITFIKQVRTPTLVLVGERDAECPVAQSREFWHALKTLGVPTQLVVYPGEGHGFALPKHRRDVIHRTVAWLDKSLKGSDVEQGKKKDDRSSKGP